MTERLRRSVILKSGIGFQPVDDDIFANRLLLEPDAGVRIVACTTAERNSAIRVHPGGNRFLHYQTLVIGTGESVVQRPSSTEVNLGGGEKIPATLYPNAYG